MSHPQPSLYDALRTAAQNDDPADHLRTLKQIQRRFADSIRSDENARETYLAETALVLEELEDWPSLYRVCQQRLQIVRPAARTNTGLIFLIEQFLRSARYTIKPTPYLCELLDDVRYVEDIAVEPAAVVALREFVRLPDFRLCGKAIYIFKKVARRYDMHELPFTKASIDKLFRAYVKRYLIPGINQ